MEHSVLMHQAGDDVGVAVLDLKPGVEARAVTLDRQLVVTVKVMKDVPLGHKLAIRDIPEGKEVVEYGRPIGRATEAIAKGAHVHTDNLKSLRW